MLNINLTKGRILQQVDCKHLENQMSHSVFGKVILYESHQISSYWQGSSLSV